MESGCQPIRALELTSGALWQWLRSDVTYHTCYERQSDLIEQVSAFEQRINACPNTVADSLWVITHLKLNEEKLRVST